MRFEIMARGLGGEIVPTGVVFECGGAMDFVDEMAIRQPFNACSPGRQDETISYITSRLKNAAIGAVDLASEGGTTEERCEAFLRQMVQAGLVRRLA